MVCWGGYEESEVVSLHSTLEGAEIALEKLALSVARSEGKVLSQLYPNEQIIWQDRPRKSCVHHKMMMLQKPNSTTLYAGKFVYIQKRKVVK